MPHDSFALVDFVANALVMGNCDPTFGATVFQPLLV